MNWLLSVCVSVSVASACASVLQAGSYMWAEHEQTVAFQAAYRQHQIEQGYAFGRLCDAFKAMQREHPEAQNLRDMDVSKQVFCQRARY